MKTSFCSTMWVSLLCGVVLCPSFAEAQETQPDQDMALPSWTVTVDPLTTALGFVHLQIERSVAPNFSIYAGPHARLFNNLLDDKSEDYVGFGLESGVRWFFSGQAPFGGWVGVRGVAASIQTTGSGETERAFGGYGSGLVGYSMLLGEWFVLAGGIGAQYIHYRVNDLGVKGVLPAAHTTFGAAF